MSCKLTEECNSSETCVSQQEPPNVNKVQCLRYMDYLLATCYHGNI